MQSTLDIDGGLHFWPLPNDFSNVCAHSAGYT